MKVSAGTRAELASVVASMRRFLDHQLPATGNGIPISLSVGSALWQPGQSFEDLLADADQDMSRQGGSARCLVTPT